MLIPITACDLSASDLLSAATIHRYCACDTETHALLQISRGRGKGGRTRYWLIVPTVKAHAVSRYFRYDGADLLIGSRRIGFFAHSAHEAIAHANRKMQKII